MSLSRGDAQKRAVEGGDRASNVLASVSGTFGGGSGKFNNISLNLDMADFGSAHGELDRTVAHEIAHAVMRLSTGIMTHPQWFVEGTAELIQGATPPKPARSRAARSCNRPPPS